MDKSREMVTVSEAARRLGVSRNAVHKYIRDGRLTPFAVGEMPRRRAAVYLVDWDEVLALNIGADRDEEVAE
mgnify:CR=1 FL=1